MGVVIPLRRRAPTIVCDVEHNGRVIESRVVAALYQVNPEIYAHLGGTVTLVYTIDGEVRGIDDHTFPEE